MTFSFKALLFFVALMLIVFLSLFLQSKNSDVTLSYLPLEKAPKANKTLAINFSDQSLKWNVTVSHYQAASKLSTLAESLGGGVCVL